MGCYGSPYIEWCGLFFLRAIELQLVADGGIEGLSDVFIIETAGLSTRFQFMKCCREKYGWGIWEEDERYPMPVGSRIKQA